MFLLQTLGRVGRVLKVYADGDLRVAVANQTWTFNPACCSIVPSIEPDNNNTNGGHEQRDHSSKSYSQISIKNTGLQYIQYSAHRRMTTGQAPH